MNINKLVIIYILAIIGVTLTAYIGVGLYFKIPPPLPFGLDNTISKTFPKLFPNTGFEPTNSATVVNNDIKLHVQKSITGNQTAFAIDGTFTRFPEADKNGMISGDFTFPGMPTGKTMWVILGLEKGTLFTGIQTEKDGAIGFKNLPLTEVLSALKNHAHVKLVMYYDTNSLNDVVFIRAYDKLSQGLWQIPEQFIVRPIKLTIYYQ
jgi:hypothetical protein